MLRQRKKSETSASSGDLPPSYEETLKVGAGPVTVVRVVTVPAPSLGPHPATMVCPGCQSQVTTATSSRPSTLRPRLGTDRLHGCREVSWKNDQKK